jgi:hypothetical protein
MRAFTQEMGKITQTYTLSGGLFLGEMPGAVQDSLAGLVILGIISARERGITIALHNRTGEVMSCWLRR